MEFENISEGLQELLDKAEELGWSYTVYEETDCNGRQYAELGKHSPAGEDFTMIIDFSIEDQEGSFLKDLNDYAEDFDVDGHVELWMPQRGKGGCPSTLKELLADAEAVKEMIKELAKELSGIKRRQTRKSWQIL